MLYAIGDNPIAARLSGARSWQVLIVLYVISALMAAVAGFVLSGLTNVASVTLANSLVLPSVAAAVIGGTSIFGGRGGYVGTILGALILTVLSASPDRAGLPGGSSPDPVRRDHRCRGGRLHPGHPGVVSPDVATRHLGLDLGATNLKWAMVELADGAWATVAREQVATRLASAPEDVPAAVVAQLGEVAAEAIRSCGPATSVGIGVPGLYDPAAGTARFLVNIPGPWAGQPIAGPVGDAVGLPAALINDARAFGLAELRLGAARGASSMIGLTLGTGVGGVIAIDGRVHQGHDGTAGEIGHQTIDPDGPNVRLREPWLRRGVRPGGPDRGGVRDGDGRRGRDARPRRRRARDRRPRPDRARPRIGIANMIAVISPDRVVIGGGIGRRIARPAVRADPGPSSGSG